MRRVKAVIDRARERSRVADARLARLADPTRCHRCGAELDTYDDIITPHDCTEATR